MKDKLGKSLFEYNSYRQFLQDIFDCRKAQNPTFSHRQFNKLVGAPSSNFFSVVVKGTKNISAKVAERIGAGLELNKDELYFFRNLVLLNQATTVEERQIYAQAVLKSRSYRKANPLAEAQYHYWTRWYFVAIRELLALPDFKENPEWIAKRLNSLISPEEATLTIDELLKLGMVKRDESGRLIQEGNAVISPDEVTSPFMGQFHEQMIKLAISAIKLYPRESREVSGLTFPVSENGLKKVKEIMQNFRKELIEILIQEKDPKGIYQFNIQFFPLAPVELKKNDFLAVYIFDSWK